LFITDENRLFRYAFDLEYLPEERRAENSVSNWFNLQAPFIHLGLPAGCSTCQAHYSHYSAHASHGRYKLF
jgi:hypothetical protein